MCVRPCFCSGSGAQGFSLAGIMRDARKNASCAKRSWGFGFYRTRSGSLNVLSASGVFKIKNKNVKIKSAGKEETV